MSFYWLVAVPKGGKIGDPLNSLRTALQSAGSKEPIYPFNVPDLKVGTLDALLALSDDLTKVDVQVEQITRKIAGQLMDLPGNKDAPLSLSGSSIDTFLSKFEWDIARHNVSDSIAELTKKIRAQVGKLEEELRTKSSEYHTISQTIAADERKKGGNLVQRTLVGIVEKKHFTVTENLTTLFVVVPKFAVKDWNQQYETLCEFVLPRSSNLIYEDKEHCLFSVILFQRKVEEFKHKARENRFFVRDLTLEELETQSSATDEAKKLEDSLAEHQKALLRWCKVNFDEAFRNWIHLKAIRIFVESVLRYGLPTNFQAVLIKPSKKEDAKLRKTLLGLFGHLGQGQFGGKDDDKDAAASQDRDFYPYVYTLIDADY